MITADSYFLHGLTKSEALYQIAGITCKKKDKEVLTVGLRTGRSLELENGFMIQNILDDLYFDLKNIKYYPFNLKYQGHLKLQVGQWVSIKTNKNEFFRVPVLNQSFTFKGGLSSTISADSKAGNDTQYSYKGFLTKKIEQVSTDLNAEVQQQLELAEQEFNQKTDGIKQEVETGIKKAQSEAKSYADTLNQEMSAKVSEVNRIVTTNKAEQDQQIRTALTQAGTADNLAKQAQQLSQQASEELRTIKAYVDNEGQRREQLEQYVRTETTSKVEALRTSINQNYIGRNQYTEDVKGITRRFEELNTNRNYILNSGNAAVSQTLELSSDFIPDVNQARTFTMSVEVEGSNIGPNPANNRKRYGFATAVTFTDDTMWYPEVWETADSSRKRIFKTWNLPAGKNIKSIRAVLINDTDKANTVIVKPKLELGNQMTPWRETAESFAEAKLAEYAQTVDGRFTRLANQYVGKTEFQKVQETSKLYERVLGSTENDLSTKVSRMVMSNQIFQNSDTS